MYFLGKKFGKGMDGWLDGWMDKWMTASLKELKCPFRVLGSMLLLFYNIENAPGFRLLYFLKTF